MALNMQIFHQLKNKRLEKNDAKYTNIIEKTPHSEKIPKENLEQSSQSRYNSHFNLNKQAYAQYKNTLHKEQSDARAIL